MMTKLNEFFEKLLGRPVDWVTSGIMAVALIASNFYVFNVGTNYGFDAGTCMMVVYAYEEDPRDVDFCEEVNPETHPIKDAVRQSYLYIIDDQVEE